MSSLYGDDDEVAVKRAKYEDDSAAAAARQLPAWSHSVLEDILHLDESEAVEDGAVFWPEDDLIRWYQAELVQEIVDKAEDASFKPLIINSLAAEEEYNSICWSEEDALQRHQAELEREAMKDYASVVTKLKCSIDAEQEFEEAEEMEEAESYLMSTPSATVSELIYHIAPLDILELIVMSCSDLENGHDPCEPCFPKTAASGGLNAFRLANKRLKDIAEACTRMLSNHATEDGHDSIPTEILERCKRIEHVFLGSYNIRSLEGCPSRLKTLRLYGAYLDHLPPLSACPLLELLVIKRVHSHDISPLASCPKLHTLIIGDSKVADLSVLSSLPQLENLSLNFLAQPVVDEPSQPQPTFLTDISPLSACKNLKCVELVSVFRGVLQELKDLSPLAHCTQLESLSINGAGVEDLSFVSGLSSLRALSIVLIPSTTSLLPVAKCSSLMLLECDENAHYGVGLAGLLKLFIKKGAPGVKVNILGTSSSN